MVFNFFKRGGGAVAESSPKIARRSSALGEFTKVIAGRQELTVLDLGPTSPQNIRHLTGLGHRIYNEDVLTSSLDTAFIGKSDDGKPTVDVASFLKDNFKYSPQQFDAVLCWDVADYLPEALVKPFIEKLTLIIKPGGALLAFFHTKDAGPDAPYYRYYIAGPDTLGLQRGPQFRLQRVFNNRHIENLFQDFSSRKFFLSRDNIREVLLVR
jgi:SAM-dependent methyltransferase